MDEQMQTQPMPQTHTSPATGWSWGGFMFQYVYLIAIRKYIYLLLYLVVLVPFIGPFLVIGLMIYFGVVGKRLAYESTAFRSDEARQGFIEAIDHAGKVLFFIVLICIAIAILAFGALFAVVGSKALNFMNEQETSQMKFDSDAPTSFDQQSDYVESDQESFGLPPTSQFDQESFDTPPGASGDMWNDVPINEGTPPMPTEPPLIENTTN